METPAQTAARLGVENVAEVLPHLLELPNFAAALAAAQSDRSLSTAVIMAVHELPAKPGVPMNASNALDVERMYAEAVSQRLRRERLEDVGRRGDGSSRSPERVQGSGLMLGKMEKAEKRVQRLYDAIERIDSLLMDNTNGGLPAVANINAARLVTKEALK